MTLSDRNQPPADLSDSQAAAIDELIASGVTPTMQDIAKIVQVSAMTVSRALRPGTSVSAAVRARVLHVVDKLNYAPDESARQFASGRSGLVAVVVPTLENALCTAFLQEVSETLAKTNLHMVFSVSDHDASSGQDELTALLRRNPEGVILWGANPLDSTRQMLAASGVPVVETADVPLTPIDNAVGISHLKVGEAMVHHLVGQGCRRIAHLGYVKSEQSLAGQRRRGYYNTVAELGLSTDLAINSGKQRSEIAQGSVDLKLALRIDPDIDALICTSDACAFGALAHCQRSGIAVPGQLAIIGFGDSDLARASLPPLSSVRVPINKIAKRAVATLLSINRITDAGGPDPAPKVEKLPFKVIARESTQPKS